jgi:hypothetical protein
VVLVGTVSFPARGRSAADDVIVAAFAGIFWAMGWRHRHLPLAAAIRETHAGMRRVEEKLDRPAPQQERSGSVIPFRRRGAR